MAQDKLTQANIDNTNPTAYPDGQIRDNDGSDNGTPVSRQTMSDQFEFFAKLMRLAQLTFSNTYDNETNGFQYIQALIALAGKNDYVPEINTALITPGTGSPFQAITIPTNIGILNINEKLIVVAAVDYGSEAKIVQTATSTPVKNVVSSDSYKAGDYLMLINLTAGIKIIRMVTSDNIDFITSQKNFLKAASNAETIAGTITTKAVTPASFAVAFANYVNGTGSDTFLASHTKNGLLSAAQWDAISNFTSPIRNVGTISGFQPGAGSPGDVLAVTGQITSATIVSSQYTPTISDVIIRVVIPNTMTDTNYFVRSSMLSLGTIGFDNDVAGAIVKIESPTQFLWTISDLQNSSKVLRVAIETVKLA